MFTLAQLADSQTLPVITKQDTPRLRDGLHDFRTQSGEFAMLFRDMCPSLVFEPDGNTVLGSNPIDHRFRFYLRHELYFILLPGPEWRVESFRVFHAWNATCRCTDKQIRRVTHCSGILHRLRERRNSGRTETLGRSSRPYKPGAGWNPVNSPVESMHAAQTPGTFSYPYAPTNTARLTFGAPALRACHRS